MDVSGLLGVILGAVLGGILTYIFSTRERSNQNQIETTLKLYERYETPEMQSSRALAIHLLGENLRIEKPKTFRQLKESAGQASWYHLMKVCQFFEQVSVLQKAHFLDDKLLKATLANTFTNWFVGYLNPMFELSEKTGEKQFRWAQPIKDLAMHIIEESQRTLDPSRVLPDEESFGD